MVGVAHILHVELPIVRKRLRKPADHFDLLVQHATDPGGDFRSDIGLNVGRIVRQGAKHQAMQRGDTHLARPVVLHAEIGRHAALPVHPVAKGDGLQVAAQIVAPGVVDAVEILHPPAIFQADHGAAMHTPVLERGDRAVFRARHHHRHGADEAGAEVADFRNVGFQAQIVPDRTFEHAALLVARDLGVAIDPVGDSSQPRGPTANRKVTSQLVHGFGFLLAWLRQPHTNDGDGRGYARPGHA